MDATTPPDDFVRLDREGLHALAHPLRLRLLSALRMHGPATATELARRLQTNSGQTSYHLRQLAAAGLIEDDPDHSTARDRYWRAGHVGTSWSSLDFRDDPDDRAADALLLGQVVRLHGRWLDEAIAARDQWDDAWVEASSFGDQSLHLTPDTLHELVAELRSVVDRYRQERQEVDAPLAERVTVMLHAFPHPEPSV